MFVLKIGVLSLSYEEGDVLERENIIYDFKTVGSASNS